MLGVLGRVVGYAALAGVLVVALGLLLAPTVVDMRMNRVLTQSPPAASPSALALHRTLLVADLHADALLWSRDLLVRHSRGHVDVPRLQEGNVALQLFSVVTKTPRGINYERNTDATDNITLLAIAQRWPQATFTSLRERALYQAHLLHEAAKRSGGTLTVITTAAQLQKFTERRRERSSLVAGVLAIEGLHALEGKLANVDALYDAGFRVMGLTHFFDNALGGSAHGVSHGGLTMFGQAVVQRMEARGIIVDLAHASPRLLSDVLAIASRPVMVSHSGVAATCPGPRNLTDNQLRAIARNGGVVGIGYWDAAVCELSVAAIVRAIRHAAEIMGVDHVALGSDFDGATETPWDTRALALITDGLLQSGVPPDDIAKVMGGNALRLLEQGLPPR